MYFLSRGVSGGYFLTHFILSVLKCALGLSGFTTPINSTLFLLRICGVFHAKNNIIGFFSLPWLATSTSFIGVMPMHARASVIGPTKYCVVECPPRHVSSTFIVPAVYDTLVFSARAETLKMTRQSIVRDPPRLSRLPLGPAVSIAKIPGPVAPRSRNYSFRSLTHLASTSHRSTNITFSHLHKAHSTSLPSLSTPRLKVVFGSTYRFYTTSTYSRSRSGLGMSISKSTPADIIKSLSERYDKAIESGDLLFFPSTNTVFDENGIEFEIRLCPALQNKPDLPTPHFDSEEEVQKAKKGSKPDPFAPPYNENLLIGEVVDEEEDAEYVVLFNKYSVVPHHILLVTKEFHSQTAPLLPSDLVQTYKLLLAARDAGKKFFAFYNCGNLSGASQPHKHLQLIPIETDGPPVERLARKANLEVPERPFALNSLPYANHVRRLPTYLSSSTPNSDLSHHLSLAFMSLLDLAISTVRHDPTYPVGPPSYNVIITLEHMHLIPRKEETYTLNETGESLSVNALGFAGMLLVKSEKELEAVKKENVEKILAGVGLKSVHELQVDPGADDAVGLKL